MKEIVPRILSWPGQKHDKTTLSPATLKMRLNGVCIAYPSLVSIDHKHSATLYTKGNKTRKGRYCYRHRGLLASEGLDNKWREAYDGTTHACCTAAKPESTKKITLLISCRLRGSFSVVRQRFEETINTDHAACRTTEPCCGSKAAMIALPSPCGRAGWRQKRRRTPGRSHPRYPPCPPCGPAVRKSCRPAPRPRP